jgi:hypothetical protein
MDYYDLDWDGQVCFIAACKYKIKYGESNPDVGWRNEESYIRELADELGMTIESYDMHKILLKLRGQV